MDIKKVEPEKASLLFIQGCTIEASFDDDHKLAFIAFRANGMEDTERKFVELSPLGNHLNSAGYFVIVQAI